MRSKDISVTWASSIKMTLIS